LKIAMFSWESLYTVQVGGLAVAVTMLAEELAEKGHEVSYFTRSAEGQPEYMRIHGVDYHAFPMAPEPSSYALSLGMSRTMAARLRRVEALRGRFDIIHGHDWLVVDALQDLKQEGRSIVMTYHSTAYGRNGGMAGDWPGFREISDRERYAGIIADRVTTVSGSMKAELNRLYGIPPDKIDVVPNAIHPRDYVMDLDPGAVKRRYGMPPGAPLILFVGRMEYQKGPDILLESAHEVLSQRPEAKFVFVGQGSMKEDLERRAWEMGLGASTMFPGFLSQLDYLEKLNACDLVVVPSRNEPFGLVLLEAWAAGKPVVAADVGGLSENVQHMVDGIKVNPDPRSVASGILSLLHNDGLMIGVAREGREKVKSYSWDASVRTLLEVYTKALG
jgi:glycogen(starch) synthase